MLDIENNHFFTVRKSFNHKGLDKRRARISCKILEEYFNIIEAKKTAKEAEAMLTKQLIVKLDQVSFGLYCEAPQQFETIKGAYDRFRVNVELHKPAIKMR